MSAPVWLGATTGFSGQAGQVNQFLAAHQVTYVYAGVQKAAQNTAGSGGLTSASHWLAQSFTTAAGQTAAGYVAVNAWFSGAPAVTWNFSIQASVLSAPSGTPLVSASVPKEFLALTAGQLNVMLPVTGLTASTGYWIVAAQAGGGSDWFAWGKSNQVSGCSTSPDGVTWTAQGEGLLYQVYDQTPALPLTGTWEDSGARWTALSYTSGLATGLREYTAGQSADGYTAANRTLSYSSGLLTGVA
jgi:hypothetical protein